MALRLLPIGLIALIALIGLAVTACGASDDGELSFGDQTPVEVAIELIEGQAMAQRLGLDALTEAACIAPPISRVGTTFPCTARSDGQTVNFGVVLEGENQLFANSTNVVDSFALTRLEQSAVLSLNRDNGFGFPDDAMDCGGRSVVLDADQQMTCTLTDPVSGTAFDAAITITDIETVAFSVQITGAIE